jgi:dihydrofolate synthase/folylpolyglutamate synthase
MPSLDGWLERIQGRHPSTIELGLERCSEVWQRMGGPRPANRIITVAGTNGKGSTVAGTEAALRFLGHKVGCYTSPHLVRYNERVRVSGVDADDREIIEGFEAVEAALGATRLTYFEFGTLAAIATMSNRALDFAILEVGLGGRLDAVNLMDADIAVITPIGLDHQEYLGSDREQIGREKAGIMRPGQTVVCSDREPPRSVKDWATSLGVAMIRIGVDFDVSRPAQEGQRGQWQFFFADTSASLPVAMNGAHQADNLAAALTTALLIDDNGFSRLDDLARRVAECRVRGRLECVAENPEVIVDVGHNPLAAGVIRDFLEERRSPRCRAVLAMLRDKDVEGVVTVLKDHVGEWFCAGLEGDRSQSGEQLYGRLKAALPETRARVFPDVATALDAARSDFGEDGLVLAFGSFLTVSEALIHLGTS